MAKTKKTKRGEIKIVEPLSNFSSEMKANIEKMLKMAHKTIDKRLTGLEKYFEKAKGEKLGTKKPAKVAKTVKAKAATVAKRAKVKTSQAAKTVKAKASKVAKKVKTKTSQVARAVKAKTGNASKKIKRTSRG